MSTLMQSIHSALLTILSPEDYCIDATVGNGHDTFFLASHSKRVIGFDIQQDAINQTEVKLRDANLLNRVNLFNMGHQYMQQLVPQNWVNKTKLIMFNLGYLPGSNKSLVTRPESTVEALNQSLNILSPNGVLSVVLYTGHPGGNEEASAVRSWANHLDSLKFQLSFTPPATPSAPEWLRIQKK